MTACDSMNRDRNPGAYTLKLTLGTLEWQVRLADATCTRIAVVCYINNKYGWSQNGMCEAYRKAKQIFKKQQQQQKNTRKMIRKILLGSVEQRKENENRMRCPA